MKKSLKNYKKCTRTKFRSKKKNYYIIIILNLKNDKVKIIKDLQEEVK